MSTSAVPELNELVARYVNTAQHNDALHAHLTSITWADPVLARHRRHVEEHALGFGDPAFHAMWASLLLGAADRFGSVRALEIGIYKGQVISLWALLAKFHAIDVEVSALGPLTGQPMPRPTLWNRIRARISRQFREQLDNGNFYPDEDYSSILHRHFTEHDLDFQQVRLYRGYSTDAAVIEQLSGSSFHIVYVDGDHSHQGALHDFRTFAPLIPVGGWLIADDAGCDLPGSSFWKGHAAVSRAVRIMPELGFRNVLNVGHNRIFERVS